MVVGGFCLYEGPDEAADAVLRRGRHQGRGQEAPREHHVERPPRPLQEAGDAADKARRHAGQAFRAACAYSLIVISSYELEE